MCPKESKENIFQYICDYPIPTYDEWKVAVEKSLKGVPFSKLLTRTYEEIVLEPMYQQKDVDRLEFLSALPGQYPFVRGTGIENNWLVAQEMTHPVPEKLNEWLKEDLQKGVNAINLVLNSDSKQGMVSKTSRRSGTAISTLSDLETIFSDIKVNRYPLVIQSGANASIIGLIAAYYEKHNLPLTDLRGYIGMDPLSILVSEGSLPNSIDRYLDQMAEILKWKLDNKLDVKTVFIDSSPYHNGGASAVQELAFIIDTAVYYIRGLQERGFSINEIAGSFCFSLSIGSNLFMELAKIRAVRILWANVIEAFGGNEESQKLTIHARTSQWTKTIYDPYVNMLRGTVEAFTAALGSVNSLHVSPFDEAFALPNTFSRRIARNIQFIIQEEAHISKTMDPAGGSWYVEHLTEEITNKSWELFQQIEALGGMYKALNLGTPQKLVNEVAAKKKADIEKRKLVFVGATMYPNNHESFPLEHYEEMKNVVEKQSKLSKQEQPVDFSIKPGNIMVDVIKAWKNGASQETIMKDLVKGSTTSIERIEGFRATDAFELLRYASEKNKATGQSASVFLTSIGPLSSHKQRSDFITSFFETGGFDVIKNNGFTDVEEAIKQTISTEATIAVLCGKNEDYLDQALEIVAAVKEQRPDMKIFVAGKQEEFLENQLLEIGLNGFIHMGTNCYQLLKQLHGEEEEMVNE
ncbi:methylmalonyl-CoA mutase [Anaerobacillus alkaliphilus]|uniref:Methylmalonyl-CoA mutase n=1 Tax=Anaerobacillus alkaliphilus TaxID=1548597 RepID=A0A4Q0VQT4_9BACI|nr:methylmalonyl-CoA mutase family protein [Anaerobacillus alkaliphilus]RXI98345.1 methylmalonyl-CoA mutase [Anaerobacillus alkaliphilus]